MNKHLELAEVGGRAGCWTGRREFLARRAVCPKAQSLEPALQFEELGEQIWKLEDQVGQRRSPW